MSLRSGIEDIGKRRAPELQSRREAWVLPCCSLLVDHVTAPNAMWRSFGRTGLEKQSGDGGEEDNEWAEVTILQKSLISGLVGYNFNMHCTEEKEKLIGKTDSHNCFQ